MEESITPVCLLIIVVTGIFSYCGFIRYGFLERYIFDVQRILTDKQYYRFFTCALLHGSWMHLFFNMLTLYFFGTDIELHCGVPRFVLIYISGILGGNLVSLIIHRNHEYRALGASGGVCGIIFAYIFLFPGSSVYMFFVPFPIPAYLYAIGFILYSYFGLRAQVDNIGHDAHLGGAIVSLIVTTMMYPEIVSENPILYPVVLIMTFVIMFALYVKPLYLPGSRSTFKIYMPEKKEPEEQIADKDEEPDDEQVLNQLLEKVSKSGVHSLTYVERQKLEMISKKKQKQ